MRYVRMKNKQRLGISEHRHRHTEPVVEAVPNRRTRGTISTSTINAHQQQRLRRKVGSSVVVGVTAIPAATATTTTTTITIQRHPQNANNEPSNIRSSTHNIINNNNTDNIEEEEGSMSANVSQLNDLRSYSRHWLGEFIDQYQTEECLWQPKHPDYSNHSVRNKAYDKLVEKLKEVEPSPDRAMVVRKINSLRSAFRREFRKSATKSNYETRLWYYDKLLFIADQNPKRLACAIDMKPQKRSLGSLGFDDDDSMDFEVDEHQMEATGSHNGDGQPQTDPIGTVTVSSGDCVTLVKSEEHHQQHNHHHQQQQQEQQEQQTLHLQQHTNAGHPHQAPQAHTTAVKVLEITSLDSNSQREIQQAVNSLEHQHHMQQQLHQHQQSGQAQIHHQQVPTIQIARESLPLFGSSTYATTSSSHRQEDEYDAIGINVASKLRVMHPTQRIIAEKLISDVLFNGQLENLSISSTLTQ